MRPGSITSAGRILSIGIQDDGKTLTTAVLHCRPPDYPSGHFTGAIALALERATVKGDIGEAIDDRWYKVIESESRWDLQCTVVIDCSSQINGPSLLLAYMGSRCAWLPVPACAISVADERERGVDMYGIKLLPRRELLQFLAMALPRARLIDLAPNLDLGPEFRRQTAPIRLRRVAAGNDDHEPDDLLRVVGLAAWLASGGKVVGAGA